MRFPRVPSGRLRLVKGALILLQEIAGDEGEPGPLGWFGSGKRLQVGEALAPVGMVLGIGIGEEAAFRGGIEQIAGRIPGELLIQVGTGGAQQIRAIPGLLFRNC